MQCYVCSKSCDYSHFDDSSRGGKKGNCPLFDSAEQRHEEEVLAAEELARKKAVEENPDVNAELLQFNFSEKVKRDDERRKAADPAHRRQALNGLGAIPEPIPIDLAEGLGPRVARVRARLAAAGPLINFPPFLPGQPAAAAQPAEDRPAVPAPPVPVGPVGTSISEFRFSTASANQFRSPQLFVGGLVPAAGAAATSCPSPPATEPCSPSARPGFSPTAAR